MQMKTDRMKILLENMKKVYCIIHCFTHKRGAYRQRNTVWSPVPFKEAEK